MEFLLDCGISEESVKKAVVNNSEQTILDAEWNMDRVVSSIDYLNEIGIKQIDKILINRFDILLRGRKNLEKLFSKLELKKVISLINKDIKYIYYLDRY